MLFTSAYVEKPDTTKKQTKKNDVNTTIPYPFDGYGFTQQPKQEDLLIKNATVWTNEADGILQNSDVLIRNGKIASIGKNLSASNAQQIDGTGKYVTAGVIDEHSHIAVSGSVNECSQSVTAEVRIADVIDPEDINIYLQLSGGVTSVHARCVSFSLSLQLGTPSPSVSRVIPCISTAQPTDVFGSLSS